MNRRQWLGYCLVALLGPRNLGGRKGIQPLWIPNLSNNTLRPGRLVWSFRKNSSGEHVRLFGPVIQ